MPRPVTLFTGQWADLPLEQLAPLVKKMGYDGVELACWGDHFDVDAAANSKKYVHDKWALLKAHGLTCYAISSHLVGQAICDNIDERHPVYTEIKAVTFHGLEVRHGVDGWRAVVLFDV